MFSHNTYVDPDGEEYDQDYGNRTHLYVLEPWQARIFFLDHVLLDVAAHERIICDLLEAQLQRQRYSCPASPEYTPGELPDWLLPLTGGREPERTEYRRIVIERMDCNSLREFLFDDRKDLLRKLLAGDLLKFRELSPQLYELQFLYENYNWNGAGLTALRIQLANEAEQHAWPQLLPAIVQLNAEWKFYRAWNDEADPRRNQEGPYFSETLDTFRNLARAFWNARFNS